MKKLESVLGEAQEINTVGDLLSALKGINVDALVRVKGRGGEFRSIEYAGPQTQRIDGKPVVSIDVF